MKFIAVRGKGDPNEEGGEYKASIGLLYGIAFTIKMSKKGSHKIDEYFDYVVQFLERFWWQKELQLMSDADREYPYEGSKTLMVIVEDVENTELMAEVLQRMYKELPEPKKKI